METGHHTEPLPTIDGSSLDELREKYERAARPVIVRGAVKSWPALHRWTPDYLARTLAGVEVEGSMNLPDSGVPYTEHASTYVRRLPMDELITRILAGERAYLAQAALSGFSAIAGDADLGALLGERRLHVANLWLGGKTKSGLHWDDRDNFLVQIWGKKRATLVSPMETNLVYPFTDNPVKSQLDPDALDLARFPKAARAVFHTGLLEPGDTLFIPKSWWHYLRADEPSISVNAWYGPHLSVGDALRMLGRGGPTVVGRVLRDMVVHGMLGRPHMNRLYSPPPMGLILYRMLRPRR